MRDALLAARASTARRRQANFVRRPGADRADRARGAGSRRPPRRGRRSASPSAFRPRTTASSPRSEPRPRPAAARSALVVRTTAETALRDRRSSSTAAAARASRPASASSTTCSPCSRSTAGSTSSCSPAAISTSTSTTRSRTCFAALRRRRSAAGARRPRRRRPLRLGDRADGRGARDRGRRPRPAAARRDRARLQRRPRRRPRGHAPPARARAVRDAGRPDAARRGDAATDDHHVAEAAFKALGRALREACAPKRRRRRARPRGRAVSRARRLRRGQPAQRLLRPSRVPGAEPTVIDRPGRRSREAPLAVIAGVGNAERGSRAASSAEGLADALVAPGRGRTARARHLRRHAAPLRRERGGRHAASALLRGRVERLRARRVPHMGWNALRLTGPTALLDGLDGSDVYFAHSFACAPADGDRRRRRSTTTARSSPRSSAARSPASSSTPSGAARPARRVLRERARMVKKRVIPCLDVARRPRRQGRPLRAAARDRATRSSWPTRYSELGADELVFLDITATLEGRGPMLELRRARRRRAGDPVHRRRRDRRRSRTRASLLRAGADKVAREPRRRRRPELCSRALADEFGAQAVVCAIDARGGEVVTHGGRNAARPRRRRLGAGGGRARRRRDPAHVDRRRRHARRLRPRADARASPQRGRRAGDRFGRRRRGDAPRRGVRGQAPRRRCVASIVHERPERLPELKRELKEAGWPSGMLAGADAGDRPGRRRRPRADARLDGRRGAAPHPRDRRGVVLEPLAPELWHKGETSGHTLAVVEIRDDCDGDAILLARPPARPASVTPARCRASRRGSWRRRRRARSDAARRLLRRRACSTRAPAAAAREGRRGRRRGRARRRRRERRAPRRGARRPLVPHATSCSRPRGLDPAAVEDELARRVRSNAGARTDAARSACACRSRTTALFRFQWAVFGLLGRQQVLAGPALEEKGVAPDAVELGSDPLARADHAKAAAAVELDARDVLREDRGSIVQIPAASVGAEPRQEGDPNSLAARVS